MNEHKHHEELIKGISEELKDILDKSDQSMYIYLDDIHKICNKRFARLLGYRTPKEWSDITTPFTESFVDSGSKNKLVAAYMKSTEKLSASCESITWKTKDGKKVKTEVILVPYPFNGHMFAVHYIE